MKTTKLDRLISFLLAVMMLFSSVPSLPAGADEDDEPLPAVTERGIGIKNIVYTTQDDISVNYQLVFFDNKGHAVSGEIFDFKDTDGSDITVDELGYFEMKANTILQLEKQPEFVSFVNSRNVSKVQIIMQENTAASDANRSLKLYGETKTKTYNIYKKTTIKVPQTVTVQVPKQKTDENGDPLYDPEGDPIYEYQTDENGDPVLDENGQPILVMVDTDSEKMVSTDSDTDYDPNRHRNRYHTLAVFETTPIVDFTVHARWRDRGEGRPDPTNYKYDITAQGADTPDDISGTPVHKEIDSTYHTYTYRVPECPQGAMHNYTYDAENSADNNIGDYACVKGDEDGEPLFTYISHKDYTCSLTWLDGNTNTYTDKFIDNGNEAENVINFILDNFDFKEEIDKSGENDEFVDIGGADSARVFDPDSNTTTIYDIEGNVIRTITYDPSSKKLSINGVEDIGENGAAKVYYLKLKNGTSVNVDDDPANTDKWKVTGINSGLNAAVEDKIYDGSTIKNLLTGEVKIDGSIKWLDAAIEDERNDTRNTDGDLVLWRYSKTGASDEKEYVAQADSMPLIKTDENGDPVLEDGHLTFKTTYTFEKCDKYDENGYPYEYYVREHLPSQISENYEPP